MNKEQHFVHKMRQVAVGINDAILTSQIQGYTIKKVNYTGSDLRLILSNGRQLIISSVDQDGKPHLETEMA